MLHGLTGIRGAGVNIQYRVPSDRSLIESYIIIQQRTKAFFNNITSNPINKGRFIRSITCWNLIIKLFILYYNNLRR